jgi:acyl carrier protein
MGERSRPEIEQALREEVAALLSMDPSAISPDASLPSLGLDSLSFVELLVFIEKTFQLNLMESGLTRKDFQTISALAACISRMT